MKPRLQLSLYPLKGGRLWVIYSTLVMTSEGLACFDIVRTTLDAEETAAFWKY